MGIKSPFIEFTAEIESLSNDTALFNFTHHLNVIPSKQIVLTTSTSTTTTTTTTTTTQAPTTAHNVINFGNVDFWSMFKHPTVTSPIRYASDEKVDIVEHGERAEPLVTENKKYIIPLALKTTSSEKEKKSTVFQDTSLHIDDLKNHILMLQNFAQQDINFQSKFVVFPHLSNATSTTMETPTPNPVSSKPVPPQSVPPKPATPKRQKNKFMNNKNQIRATTSTSTTTTTTIIPEVILQNDQSPGDDPNVDEKERRRLEKKQRRAERKKQRLLNQSSQSAPGRRNNKSSDSEFAEIGRKLSRPPRGTGKIRKKSINSLEDVKVTKLQPQLDSKLCHTTEALSDGQKKLCDTNINVMPVISRAARAALQNCASQLKHRRWDCQTVDDNTVFGSMVMLGAPEMAFVHALSSASVMSFIARACRDGQFASCGCSRGPRPHNLKSEWVWGGCGDDFEFAYKFSQRFVDSREKELRRLTRAIVSAPPKELPKLLDDAINATTETGTDTPSSNITESYTVKPIERIKLPRKGYKNNHLEARSLMNLHNNEAGRRAVVKKSRINCKCHGVSGSCSIITCWQQLTSIKDVAEYLREKYDAATQVKMNSRKKLQVRDYHARTVPMGEDLVYIDSSPDFCRSSKQLGWKGTHGRVCNRTSNGLDSCSVLCCGRGYNTKKMVVREKCNCKFHWCCEVKCKFFPVSAKFCSIFESWMNPC